MEMLYTDEELSSLSAKIKRRSLATLFISLPFWLVMLACMIIHPTISPSRPFFIPDQALKIIACVTGVLAAFICIFGLCYFVTPLKSYRKHMQSGLHGRTHDISYEFASVDPYESVIENITYRSITVKGEPDRHGIGDHMLYWDASKPIPEFTEGEQIILRYYDRFVVGWSR